MKIVLNLRFDLMECEILFFVGIGGIFFYIF